MNNIAGGETSDELDEFFIEMSKSINQWMGKRFNTTYDRAARHALIQIFTQSLITIMSMGEDPTRNPILALARIAQMLGYGLRSLFRWSLFRPIVWPMTSDTRDKLKEKLQKLNVSSDTITKLCTYWHSRSYTEICPQSKDNLSVDLPTMGSEEMQLAQPTIQTKKNRHVKSQNSKKLPTYWKGGVQVSAQEVAKMRSQQRAVAEFTREHRMEKVNLSREARAQSRVKARQMNVDDSKNCSTQQE
jgi:hypothetical protein